MGTPDFIAPEQALDSHNVDIRADVYSLGCTLYYLLTGKAPFGECSLMKKLMMHQSSDPKPAEELRPEVPNGLALDPSQDDGEAAGRPLPDAGRADRRTGAADGRRSKPAANPSNAGADFAAETGAERRQVRIDHACPRGAAPAEVGRREDADLHPECQRFDVLHPSLPDDFGARAAAGDVEGEPDRRARGGPRLGDRPWLRARPSHPGLRELRRPGADLEPERRHRQGPRRGRSPSRRHCGRRRRSGQSTFCFFFRKPERQRPALGIRSRRAAARLRHPHARFCHRRVGLCQPWPAAGRRGHGRHVHLWDTTAKIPAAKGTLKGHKNTIRALAFASDNETVASASEDGTVRIWDLSRFWSKERAVLQGDWNEARSLAFAPGYATIALGCLDQTVRLYDVGGDSPASLHVLRGHQGTVRLVHFNRDKRTLLSICDGGRAIKWNVKSGEKEKEWLLPRGKVYHSVAVTHDGRYVAIGDSEGAITLFRLYPRHEGE